MGSISQEKLSVLRERPFWIHAVSVGEVQAASALINQMRADGFSAPIVLSTTTETGKAMAMRLSRGLFDLHIYYPWDSRKYVRAALDKINPRAFVLMETEIWPNMLWELEARHIPVFLANGRISTRTWKRIQKGVIKKLFTQLFGSFAALFVREKTDVAKLLQLGIAKEKIVFTGNFKIDALLERVKPEIKTKWQEILQADKGPLYIAGSTHTGEDELVAYAFEKLKTVQPNARLILAPRHPERTDAIYEQFKDKFSVCRLSALQENFEIVIIDKIGVLFELYSVAESAFVGGSFTDDGGQNILEPAVWGVPVEYGPHMEDFEEASTAFLSRGISRQLQSADDLAQAWIELATAEAKRKEIAKRCKSYFDENAGAAKKCWQGIKKQL